MLPAVRLANARTNRRIKNRIKPDITLEIDEEIFSIKSIFKMSNLIFRYDVIESISLSIFIIIYFFVLQR
tara:strand:- start:279 stop:488 length:210 start_codon:yes stop_codon:yes gene_type:complete